jgi:flagellar hook protein FlgE
MSLYGALFGGVSGLRAQSSKIGAISDNIANVNTIGYKQATATFQTLVVNSSGGGSYQTGGVRGGTVLNVSKQGLLQSTESATDIAISGAGFFVVRQSADFIQGDSSSTPYYTRAGSFTQDALGNFRNTQGFFLQGWPLDREGRLPGEVGNLNTTSFTNFDSLETVNVESASGVAQSTSSIALGANLKASQSVYPGEAVTLTPDNNTANNLNLPSAAIIAGSEFSLDNGTTVNDVRRGDRFTVVTGNGLSYTYEYGGYTIGRQVTTVGGTANYGDGGEDHTTAIALDANGDVDFAGTNSFDITIPGHGLITGDSVALTGFGANLGATPFAQLNATHTITRVDADTIRITVATAHGQSPGDPIVADAFTADIRVFQGNILDATSSTGVFLIQTGVTNFTSEALTFNVASATAGTKTFRYTTTAPNTANGEFNSLSTLATAIDTVSGLTARVVNGRLVVGAQDSSEAVTFTNGDGTGTATKRGIDWIGELDVKNVAVGNRRYSSLNGLASLVNADEGVTASITNPLSSASIDIRVDDPLDTITLNDLSGVPVEITTAGTPITIPAGTYVGTRTVPVTVPVVIASAYPTGTVAGSLVYISGLTDGLDNFPGALPNGGPFEVASVGVGTFTINVPVTQTVTFTGGAYAAASGNRVSLAGSSNQGSVLAQLGAVDSLNATDYLTAGAQTTGVLGPQYDPTGQVGENMASGDITAQFSRNVRIYDSLGSGHDVRFSFIKIATNTWAVEAHMIPETDISTSLVDGQIATGNIVFNGDGTLRSMTASLQNPITVTWRNGAEPSTLTLDLGTSGEPFGTVGASQIGLSDGISQFDSSYNVNFANQNGAPVGQLVSVAITEQGIIVASYSNGETQELYKLPLADFANPDGLLAISGNVFAQTRDSGEVNLREAGTNGTGTLVSAALEASNVDLAEQLTDMIVAQRAYQANTRVIKTTDELLEQLNQI